jgi:hypothetical protein
VLIHRADDLHILLRHRGSIADSRVRFPSMRGWNIWPGWSVLEGKEVRPRPHWSLKWH